MKTLLKICFLAFVGLITVSAGCEKKTVIEGQETFTLHLLYNIPGSCPTYFFNSLDGSEAYIPKEASKVVIESFVSSSQNPSIVKVVGKKTGQVIQHYCGDREPNPQLHPFFEIKVFSISAN